MSDWRLGRPNRLALRDATRRIIKAFQPGKKAGWPGLGEWVASTQPRGPIFRIVFYRQHADNERAQSLALDERDTAASQALAAQGDGQQPEVQPYRLIEGDLRCGLILLCDHAENRVPAPYRDLGLDAAMLRRHIAYDPGAAEVTEELAAITGAPALLTRFSRLVIDPNRGADDPTQIMQISDGVVIPGNAQVDAAERQARNRLFYAPYDQAIAALIGAATEAGRVPALLAVHSFTPAWKGETRPWHAGVLWDKDDRLAGPLLKGLEAEPGLVVGENVPYSGELPGDTLNRHGTRKGIAHALVEIRQDLLLRPEQQAAWAARLARVLQCLLADEEVASRLSRIAYFGSRTDAAAAAPEGEAAARPASPTEQALRTELEAAVFRRLREHLRARSDVQNLDLMELAGFCRNCLSNWYQEAAAANGLGLSKEEARNIVYGMAYAEWKARFQR
jgi:predicted N-formylglutamate amidohydrolase